MPVELVDGMNSVVVPLADSNTVRLGWFCSAAPEFVVPVAYSYRASLIAACNLSTSSFVRLSRIFLTSESVRTVRDILRKELRCDYYSLDYAWFIEYSRLL
jgi:hypothetical protein